MRMCRPHDLQRCMSLVVVSARALVTALMVEVAHSLDAAGSQPKLHACAAQLGALYAEAAEQGSVRLPWLFR